MTRVWRITVTCEQCGSNVVDFDDQPWITRPDIEAQMQRDGRVPDDAPSDWRMFYASAWGHGAIESGGVLAAWYDTPADRALLGTRSHVDPTTGLAVLLCAARHDANTLCGNRAEFSASTTDTVLSAVAGAGRDRVSIEEMRLVARGLGTTRRPRRR